MLAATALAVDLRAVTDRLVALDPIWVAAGLALSVPTYALLAWRWQFVAERMGTPLGYRAAWADYYLGDFFNVTLPFGVAGSAMRAVRHASRVREREGVTRLGDAVRALVVERVAGLAVLAAAVVGCAAYMAAENPGLAAIAFAAVGAVVVSGALAYAWSVRRGRRDRFLALALRRALVGRGALGFHALISSAVLALLVASFYCAGRAAGVELAAGRVIVVTPLILGSMVIPLSIAGWGVREAAAAALFGALGLGGAAGVAVSVTYGAVGLIQTVPGAVVWLAGADGARSGARAATLRGLGFPLWMAGWAVAAAVAGQPLWFAAAGAAALVAWLLVAGRERRALPANLVTLGRVAVVASLPWCAVALPNWGFAAVALACFAADGLDGWLARRRDAATAFGAAFDQDTDAYFVMTLCLVLVTGGVVPAWGLVAGLWRYAYAALIRVVPARGEAPRSRIGRYVFAVLVGCLIGGYVLPSVAVALVAAGTALVSWSFIRSLIWSLRPPAAASDGSDAG